ncbi:hypothetical protein [Polaromonas sp. JS666]|uniref:hypothetical protein n=1 Tax=Polaromonas sp. (strain JS666 / ATCC BAA-500) TaxID=296591 RepID=UPI0011144545|nr:hypothetical protein [Polaromonas sp. JS666]
MKNRNKYRTEGTIKKTIALACITLSAQGMHGNVSAQQGLLSAGDYYRDMGVIFGVIEAVHDIADICSEEFPETRETNEKHYQAWRAGHQDLLQEVERHRARILEHAVLGARYKLDLHNRNLTFKTNQRLALAKDGAATFRANCNQYGDMTRLQQWDINSSLAKQVATMRRGPPQ